MQCTTLGFEVLGAIICKVLEWHIEAEDEQPANDGDSGPLLFYPSSSAAVVTA
jgi:hypothetical protein